MSLSVPRSFACVGLSLDICDLGWECVLLWVLNLNREGQNEVQQPSGGELAVDLGNPPSSGVCGIDMKLSEDSGINAGRSLYKMLPGSQSEHPDNHWGHSWWRFSVCSRLKSTTTCDQERVFKKQRSIKTITWSVSSYPRCFQYGRWATFRPLNEFTEPQLRVYMEIRPSFCCVWSVFETVCDKVVF